MNSFRIAITGATGFVGRHLVDRLLADGHTVVSVSRSGTTRVGGRLVGVAVGLDDVDGLTEALRGCDAVVHLAGINREAGDQTFQAVHVDGTRNVVASAERADVGHVSVSSFLRARPGTGWAYHQTKWEAEELVRGFGGAWTVLKPGIVAGEGDQFITRLAGVLRRLPFATGFGERRVAPVFVEDLVDLLVAASVDRRLDARTVEVVGPTVLRFDDAARMIGRAVGRRVLVVAVPIVVQRAVARLAEGVMQSPFVSRAQVLMLSEGLISAAGPIDALPDDLVPTTGFTEDRIAAVLAST